MSRSIMSIVVTDFFVLRAGLSIVGLKQHLRHLDSMSLSDSLLLLICRE